MDAIDPETDFAAPPSEPVVDSTKPFLDLEGKPTFFYLLPPLDTNGELVRLIEEGGGVVSEENAQYDTIIIGSPESIPDEFRKHRVFNYKYIEASIEKGMALNILSYLIPGTGVPEDSQKAEDAVSADEAAQAAAAVAAAAAAVNHSHDLADHVPAEHIPDHDNNVPVHHQNALRYFTPEEDYNLLQEIRKRPWMGYKGHQIYKDISELDYFKMKNRTAASLRERIRTLRYNVGFRYVADDNHNLLTDENGEYIKNYDVRKKTTPFTAIEDFEICKNIYQNLSPTLDAKGFDQITFPTGFYDRYSETHPGHTSESWRQRYKNFIVYFGVSNYLKYYIITHKHQKTPLPSNLANKDWLKARLHLKRGDGPRIYFPGIPEDDKFLEDNLDSIEIPKFPVDTGDGYYENQKFIFDQESHGGQGLSDHHVLAAVSQSNAKDDMERAAAAAAQRESMKMERARKRVKMETHIDPAINEYQETEFHDESTTEFTEPVFKNAAKTNGPPLDLSEILPRKEEFLAKLRSSMGDDEPEETKAFVKKLVSLGIQEYYLIYLISRAGANKILIEDCIKNYIETDGKELLAREKGVWSNKSLEYLTKKDDTLNQLLIDYHGIASFNHQYDSFMLRQLKK